MVPECMSREGTKSISRQNEPEPGIGQLHHKEHDKGVSCAHVVRFQPGRIKH